MSARPAAPFPRAGSNASGRSARRSRNLRDARDRCRSDPAAVLVRPDGHVAWVSMGECEGLVDALTTWFGD
ncbi:hypothetical protein AB8Z38_27745 [Bradyrhizobium sp. LLZ17]|uniref:Monooxygenase n=1 Tax=Bradyrhizobium sp. LLZ17 TaxID=3239388 RepID=A0AB39XVS0_9BRAD